MYGYSCDADAPPWPGLPMLAGSAAIGVAGLLAAQLTLTRLAQRTRPADDPDSARLDDVLRRMSARAMAGGAVALALALASAVSAAVDVGAHSSVCLPRPGQSPLVPAYPWAASLAPWLQWAPFGLMVAALVILAVCRRCHGPRYRPFAGAAR